MKYPRLNRYYQYIFYLFFFLFLLSDNKDRPNGSGYFLVDPNLRAGKYDERIPLDCVTCQTVLAKSLGPFTQWKARLQVAIYLDLFAGTCWHVRLWYVYQLPFQVEMFHKCVPYESKQCQINWLINVLDVFYRAEDWYSLFTMSIYCVFRWLRNVVTTWYISHHYKSLASRILHIVSRTNSNQTPSSAHKMQSVLLKTLANL